MKNPNISKVLKNYRKLNHYSVNDLVLKLEDPMEYPFETKSPSVPPNESKSINCCKCPEVTVLSFRLLTGCCFMRLIA